MIRLGHEVDDAWPSWSARNNGAEYIAAFRHVHDVLSSESPGFRFDWTSTRAGFGRWGLPAYPGDAYVDVIGLDTYWRDAEPIPDRTGPAATSRCCASISSSLGLVEQAGLVPRMGSSIPQLGPVHRVDARLVRVHFQRRGRAVFSTRRTSTIRPSPGYKLNNYPTTRRAYIETFKDWGRGSAGTSANHDPPPTTATPTTSLRRLRALDQTTTTVASSPGGADASASVFSRGPTSKRRSG